LAFKRLNKEILYHFSFRRIQVNQDGLKLNCTHQLLVYADDVYILDGSVYTVKKNTKALLFASKETGLKINADKTKYMVLPQGQNAGYHNIKTDNKSFERVEQLKYLVTTLKNQNSIQEKVNSWLKSGNTFYHSVQNLLSSNLLSKNKKIKIFSTIILPVVLYRCETWSFSLTRNIG